LQIQYVAAIEKLQTHLGKAFVPARLKEEITILIAQPWSTHDESNAELQLGCLNNMFYATDREVNAIALEGYEEIKALAMLLHESDIHASLKVRGQQLLAEFKALHRDGSNLTIDDTFRLTAELRKESAAIQANFIKREACIKEKRFLAALLSNQTIHPSLKVEGRNLLNKFNEVESCSTSTLKQLSEVASKIEVYRTNTHKRQAMRNKFVDVLKKIEVMRNAGNYLRLWNDDPSKGRAIITLSDTLETRIASFVNAIGSETPQTLAAFDSDFKRLLHTQDKLMNEHRAIWKPIIANVLIALTGIGLIAIAIKASSQAIKPRGNAEDPSRMFNHSLFFAKTRTQEQLENIETTCLLSTNNMRGG
jgi:hypothetical protein